MGVWSNGNCSMSINNKKNWGIKLTFFFLQGCSIESCWQHRHEMESEDSGMAASPTEQAGNQLSAQGFRGWVQALWALAMDRFLTPKTPSILHFCHRANSSPAKGMMEQVLQIKGETQPVKKILPRLSGFNPFGWLNFIILVPSRTALGLLQPAPCRPCQGLQRNHEGPIKCDTIHRNSLHHPQTTIWHLTVLQC